MLIRLSNRTQQDHRCHRGLFTFLLTLILCSTLSLSAIAGVDWNPKNRVPIREHTLNCRVFLVPQDQVIPNGFLGRFTPRHNHSVGVQVAESHGVDEFKASMREVLETQGAEAIRGSILYVTAVVKGSEAETEAKYTRALRQVGIGEELNISVRTIVVPLSKIQPEVVSLYQKVVDTLRYWPLNPNRHYQPPIPPEVISAMVATVALESPNIYLLFQKPFYSTVELTAVVTSLLTVLFTYDVFKKTSLNWLQDPGSGPVGLFLKQIGFSVPFIIVFSLIGQSTDIAQFIQTHNYITVQEEFFEQAWKWLLTQGPTAVLQTLFYSTVIIKGFGRWVYEKKGSADSDLARSLVSWLQGPFLAVDSWAMSQAGGNVNPLRSWGPITINDGHATILGLTAVGSIFLFRPIRNFLLDPSLGAYRWVRNRFRTTLPTDGPPNPEQGPTPD